MFSHIQYTKLSLFSQRCVYSKKKRQISGILNGVWLDAVERDDQLIAKEEENRCHLWGKLM